MLLMIAMHEVSFIFYAGIPLIPFTNLQTLYTVSVFYHADPYWRYLFITDE